MKNQNHASFLCLAAMAVLVLWAAGLRAAEDDPPLSETDQCLSCHLDDDVMPQDYGEHDIHMQKGLSCAGCHGGDPANDDMDDSMSPAAGYVGIPDKKDIPRFCGKCHSDIDFMRQYQPAIQTDQAEQYGHSVHGAKLMRGDTSVAVCTSCHSGHNIMPASDPRSTVYALNVPETCNKCHGDAQYMKKYDIPTDQYEKFKKSVHGQALLEEQDTGAPACNDCHGNHGAMPPGITSISHVCGTCHINNMEYFAGTKMAAGFKKKKLHGCEECHGNHEVPKPSDKMIGDDKSSVCAQCHESGDKGFLTARVLRTRLDTLAAAYRKASVMKERVNSLGMDDLDIEFILQEAKQSLTKARTMIHTFDTLKVSALTTEGLVKNQQAIREARVQIEAYYIRRKGLGASTFIITLLIVALYLKIREIERRQKSTTGEV